MSYETWGSLVYLFAAIGAICFVFGWFVMIGEAFAIDKGLGFLVLLANIIGSPVFAILHWREARRAVALYCVAVLFFLGAYGASNQKAKVHIGQLQIALTAEPENPYLNTEIGQLLLNANRAPEAIPYLENARAHVGDAKRYCKRSSCVPPTYDFFLQNAYLGAGRDSDFVALVEKSLLQDRYTSVYTIKDLAKAHRRLGHAEQARNYFHLACVKGDHDSCKEN